ncbi:hypothetical protein [Aquimarina hainanensis]
MFFNILLTNSLSPTPFNHYTVSKTLVYIKLLTGIQTYRYKAIAL